MENLLNSQDPSVMQAIVTDPFQKDKWQMVAIHIYNVGPLRKKVEHSAMIEFKNGDTEGKQRFTADDFPSLLTKIQSFITTLK